MTCSLFCLSQRQEVIALFTRVFGNSEGAEAGNRIGQLVIELIDETPAQDRLGCVLSQDSRIVGSIFFSRFLMPGQQKAFLLSPVAVATQVQRTGIGQQLIHYGLEQVRKLEAEIVLTYGDPAYYCKSGFSQISETTIPAPYQLSMPFGWQAQSLSEASLTPLSGETHCVKAFCDPGLW